MSNPYDQFVSPPPAAAKPNPYEQFATPPVAGNIYDQFETPSATRVGNIQTRVDTPEEASLPILTPQLAAGLGLSRWRDPLGRTEVPRPFPAKVSAGPLPQSGSTGGGKPFFQSIPPAAAIKAQGSYAQAGKEDARIEKEREMDTNIEIAREILRLHKETDGNKDIYGVLPESKRLAEVKSEISSLFPPGDTWQIPPRDETHFDRPRYEALNSEQRELEQSIEKQLTPPDNRTPGQIAWDTVTGIQLDQGKLFKPEWEDLEESAERRANRPKNLERLRALQALLPVEDFEKLRGAVEATDWKNNRANYARLPDGRIRFRPEVFNSRGRYERTIEKIVADGEWTAQQGAVALAEYDDIEREQDEMKFQQARKTRSFQDYTKDFFARPKNQGKTEADAWKAYRDTPFYMRLRDIAGYLSDVAIKGALDNVVYPGALLGIQGIQGAAAATDTKEAHSLADRGTKLLLDSIGKPGYWDDVRGSGSEALDAAVQSVGQLIGQAALYRLGGRRMVMVTAPMQTAMEAYTSAYQANAKYGPDGKVTNGEEAHKIATKAARGGAAGGLLDLLPLESVMARVPNGGIKGVGKAILSGLLETGTELAQDRWTQAINQAVSPGYVRDEGIDWEQYAGMGLGIALTDIVKQGIERGIAGRHTTHRRETPIMPGSVPPTQDEAVPRVSTAPTGTMAAQKYDPEKRGEFETSAEIPAPAQKSQPPLPTGFASETSAPLGKSEPADAPGAPTIEGGITETIAPNAKPPSSQPSIDLDPNAKYPSPSHEHAPETAQTEPVDFRRAASDLGASARAIQEAQPGTSPRSAEADALRRSAQIPRIDRAALGAPDTEASEHTLWIDPQSGFVLKATANARFGHDFDRHPGGATPTDYLERMALSAEVFGDSVRLLGKFLDEDGNPGFVIQQNFVHGDPERPNPTAAEISEYLDTLGFQPVPGKPGRFLNDDEGVEIDDTHPGNFIRSTDGSLHPIDLMIRRTPTPGLRRKIQSSLDDAAPHPGVWTDITNYGRAIFGKGMDFVDWSVRMVKDLGKKITPYLRTIFHAINGGPWNDPKRIHAGIDARSLSRPETDKAVDQETKLNKSMAEWKRQGAQASIREEAAASRAGALRDKLDLAEAGTPLNEALFREIADFGRLVFRQGMDYLDWSMRMVRDLGTKITAHLPRLWRAVQEAAGRLSTPTTPDRALSPSTTPPILPQRPRTGDPNAQGNRLFSPPQDETPSGDESAVGQNLPPHIIETAHALYRPGVGYLKWAGQMVQTLGPEVDFHLAAAWAHAKGTPIRPAQSMAEALPVLEGLAKEQRILEEILQSIPIPTLSNRDWRYWTLKSRLSELAEESRQLISVPLNERRSVLYSNNKLPAEIAEILRNGAEIASCYIAPNLVPQNLRTEIIYSGDSNYNPENRTIYIRDIATASSVMHEISHDVEHSSYKMRSNVVRFLMKRAKSGEEILTSAYLNDPKYSNQDKIYKDRWEELGGDSYTGRFYPDGSTEILSTGIERLHRNPAKFYATDREFFIFVVTTLREWYN